MALEFELSFAGVPFVLDVAKVVRLPMHGQGEMDDAPGAPKDQLPPRKHQPAADLIDELDRLLPFCYLNDFKSPSRERGRNLGAIAYPDDIGPQPSSRIKIGDWYYPPMASRWSVFRGLATSAMAKAMLASAKGVSAKTFTMKANPLSPDNPTNSQALYTLSSQMFMLPPRPLGEHGGTFDGLYLITLVDERYYWANTPASLRVTSASTWAGLISQIASLLGVTITHSAISAAYGQPEPDSQLWTNAESVTVLLDAIACNVGRVAVRRLNGTYELMTPVESKTTVIANRGNVLDLVRTAGGDMFNSGTKLPIGSLFNSRNSVVADNVQVTFPKYVRGDDPVPHYLNARYANQRPSCWYEESYGDVHTINVGVSGGGSLASGVSGVVNDYNLHTTAKALYATEAATTGNPLNQSGLNALSLQLAQDYYGWQLAAALDESYPGTFTWAPEGIHDIVWTWSARDRMACTRVLRAEWNQTVREFQHAAPALSGQTTVTRGVGGPSVPQTWRDSTSGHTTTLAQTLDSGSFSAVFAGSDNLPTQNRWKGQINDEVILFEGTSGGTTVGIVYRGIDDTIQAEQANASTVAELSRHPTYGINLATVEKMQRIFPGAHTSGGIQEVVVVPQTQTVRVFSASGQTMGGIIHYSGEVSVYSPVTGAFPSSDLVWVRERNDDPISSGRRYDGQFVGFSLSGPIAPLYLINAAGSGLGGGGGSVLSGTLQWFHFLACGLSGINCSGFIFNQHLASGAVNSGKIASGIIQWWHFAQCSLSGIDCSGFIFNQHLASGPVVDWYNIAGNAIRSGQINLGGVHSGNIASGFLGDLLGPGTGKGDANAIRHENFTNFLAYYVVDGLFGNEDISTNALSFTETYHQSIPIIAGRNLTIDRIGVAVTGSGASGARCHINIYETVSPTNLYPGTRIGGTGELNLTLRGFQEDSVSINMQAGRLYWADLQLSSGLGSPAPTIHGIQPADGTILGKNSPASGFLDVVPGSRQFLIFSGSAWSSGQADAVFLSGGTLHNVGESFGSHLAGIYIRY